MVLAFEKLCCNIISLLALQSIATACNNQRLIQLKLLWLVLLWLIESKFWKLILCPILKCFLVIEYILKFNLDILSESSVLFAQHLGYITAMSFQGKNQCHHWRFILLKNKWDPMFCPGHPNLEKEYFQKIV